MTMAQGAVPKSAAPRGSDRGSFDISFSRDFQGNAVGPYRYDEWEKDWDHPSWSCPDRSHWATGAKMEIVQEGDNRFLRHRFDPGDFSTTGELGMQWETALPARDEVYLSFRARCSDVFALEHLDGKLPGLKGKPAAGRASTGPGERPGPDGGFSSRQMFKGGDGDRVELMPYIYHQEMEANSKTEDGKPLYYGNSFGPRPALVPNTWYTITQRLVMNGPGVSNGIAEFYVDGKLVSSRQGFRFRDTDRVMIDTISMSNFLGGSGDRATVQGYWDFDDIVVFAYRPGVSVPRGPVLSPAGRTLTVPASPK
jgi:hypothetical protein